MKLKVKFNGVNWNMKKGEEQEIVISQIIDNTGIMWTICPGYEIELAEPIAPPAPIEPNQKQQTLQALFGPDISSVHVEFKK